MPKNQRKRNPDPESLRRQSAVLRDLRAAAGLTRTEAAARLGMSAENYGLYERGRQLLTVESLGLYARVFGITKAELVERLGLIDDAPRPLRRWWGRTELERAGIPQHEIDTIEAELPDYPEPSQRAVIEDVIREWRERTGQDGRHAVNGS